MMPIVKSPSEVPADVHEMEGRDGKTYYGKELEELRKKDRQEAARKQLEKDESFGQKASDTAMDVAGVIPKLLGFKSVPDIGAATTARKQRIEKAKKELGMKKGGSVKSKASSASKRGDGIAQRGKTRGRFI